MTATFRYIACLALIISSTVISAAELTEIIAYPSDIGLYNARDRQTITVQAVFADGLTRDVTAEATIAVADQNLIKLEGTTLAPTADGETTVSITFGGKTLSLPAVVKDSAVTPELSFKLDIMPIFMKANCNTGSCHGAASGKDGFRLSLFGFDHVGDYQRVTREIGNRRINLAFPHESLMLTKSTAVVPHTGGTRFRKGDSLYNLMHEWIDAGAVADKADIPTCTKIEVYPKSAVLDGEGATQKITVRAFYSDGTNRDVSHLAFFLSSNENSVLIEQDGTTTALNRGEAFVMARFDTHTVGTHFIVLPKGLDFTWKELPENNYVDTLLHEKFKKLRIIPSELCSDEEFLRRATLDITGRVPTVDEYNIFLADADPKKRDKLVDDLLGRKEFVELWVMKWAELLTIRTTNQISYKSMLLYYTWLQDKIANNVPMNVMVQDLLASNGGTFANAATNYYQNERDTLKVAENVAQVFMGMRIQCAQCHNHPFDRWTMDDYYSFAAFFSQIGRKAAEDPREIIVFNSGSGVVRHPVGNRVMEPKFLGGETPDVQGKDRRQIMAKWLASNDNPYFARNLSNIVWAHFFGQGIINEVDDVRVSNPPVNVALLDTLASKFTEYNYDFKKIVRDICTSRAYQLSTGTNETNEKDSRNFSHAALRRMRAEIMLDAITQITSTSNKFPGLPNGARAVQIANGNTSTYFLTTFGRAKRETVCACEVKMEPNLSQALHMLNGDTVNSKITQGKLIPTRLGEEVPIPQILEELYIRCLCRKPTEKELTNLMEIISQEENKQQALEDTFWALLNSREFLFNH
ncbi:MAG TPA: DUF1549 domain-containing protein [Planctomycetaceae bacterium]|nr:DUF1549 domain-containing protein [Planctomycetaceae bacterium]